MKVAQKLFGRQVQVPKLKFWRQQQEYLLACTTKIPSRNTLGIKQERNRTIPMEVVLEDGSTSTDQGVILRKLRTDFQTLLNS